MMQPDIEEEEEIDFDNTECEAVEQPRLADNEPATHDGAGEHTENDDKQKRFGRLWVRMHLSSFASQSLLIAFLVLSICSCQRCASFAVVRPVVHEMFLSASPRVERNIVHTSWSLRLKTGDHNSYINSKCIYLNNAICFQILEVIDAQLSMSEWYLAFLQLQINCNCIKIMDSDDSFGSRSIGT
jgi:hypothetical protein